MSNKLVKNKGSFNFTETGMIFDSFIGRPDSTLVDVNDSGIEVYVLMNNPSRMEQRQINVESRIKVRLLEMNGIIFFLFKFGNLNWFDAPYSVHLSKGLTYLQDIADGRGYLMKIHLIDTSTGRLLYQRQFGLDTDVSRTLKVMVEHQKVMPFNQYKYELAIKNIYSMYSSMDLVKMSMAS